MSTPYSPNSEDISSIKEQQRTAARSFDRVDNDVLTSSNGYISPSVSQARYPRVEAFTDVINSRYTF